ncbi:MAG: 30S ribosomal protein S6 [Armatimonadota bacterium]
MVRAYEALYIVHPELQDEAVTSSMEKYKSIIEEQGGEVQDVNRWEKRRLAYEVKGQREGIYVLMNFKAEAKVATELDRRFKIADDVIRHIIVRSDEV